MTAKPTSPQLDSAQLDLLLRLLDTPAPSGYEQPVADVFASAAASFAEVESDAVGNQYAIVNRGASRRVMIAGHLDEIGFVVTRIDSKTGLIRFEPIGGWSPELVMGQRIRVMTESGPLPGHIGCLPVHQTYDHKRTHPKLKDMWIDVGAVDGDEANELVRIGDPIVLDATPHVYANRRVLSRSADNRIGIFIALQVARACVGDDVEVIALGSVSEETTQFGAEVAAYRTEPDAAIVVDVTWTSDVPGDHGEDISVGKGPVISFGAAARSRNGAALLEVARGLEMDVQVAGAGTNTYTDAEPISRAGNGVSTGVVSVATRYLHSPGELFDLRDVEDSIALLAQWARAYSAE